MGTPFHLYRKPKEPKAPPPPHIVFYVICANEDTAKLIAEMALKFKIPCPYPDEKVAYLAFEQQPRVMKHKYFPFRVAIELSGNILSVKQLRKEKGAIVARNPSSAKVSASVIAEDN